MTVFLRKCANEAWKSQNKSNTALNTTWIIINIILRIIISYYIVRYNVHKTISLHVTQFYFLTSSHQSIFFVFFFLYLSNYTWIEHNTHWKYKTRLYKEEYRSLFTYVENTVSLYYLRFYDATQFYCYAQFTGKFIALLKLLERFKMEKIKNNARYIKDKHARFLRMSEYTGKTTRI